MQIAEAEDEDSFLSLMSEKMLEVFTVAGCMSLVKFAHKDTLVEAATKFLPDDSLAPAVSQYVYYAV